MATESGVVMETAQKAIESLGKGFTKKLNELLIKEEARARSAERQERERRKSIQIARRRESRRASSHYMLARKGLSALIALGGSAEMRKLLDTKMRAQSKEFGYFVFYEASRPSGDAWNLTPEEAQIPDNKGRIADGSRDACIRLYPDASLVMFGSVVAEDMDSMEFLYNDATEHASFLRDLVSSGDCGQQDAIQALNHKQRTYEWQPEEVVAKVLMDCAHPKRFARYLSIAIKREKVRMG